MFLDFYHIREQPFGVTPDPRYLYLSPTHREALASLYCGVEEGRGFMAMIAQPGMGKTTLLFHLLERLRKSACAAFLFQTQCDSREFFRYLLEDLGIESHGHDVVQMHKQLNGALIRLKNAGMRFVLIVDEAQNLDDSVLETVRLLSDFETPTSKLIQIILSGQPQLATKLAGPSLLQFRQRIAIVGRLEPLGLEETDRYIDHRLQVAGYGGDPLFTSDARAMIAARSGGIPRNINNLCFNALRLGCELGRKNVDGEIVLEAACDLDFEGLAPVRNAPAQSAVPPPQAHGAGGLGRRPFRAAALAASLVLASLFLFPSVRGLVGSQLRKVFSAHSLPVAKSPSLNRPTPGPAVSAAAPAPKNETAEPAATGTAQPVISDGVVEVKPGQTLWQIILGHFGRSDQKLFEEIRALNPRIADPNHIETGQRIVLPGRTRTTEETHAAVPADGKPTTSARD